MFRFLSLTGRLTLFSTMVIACIVIGLGVLLMMSTERHFLELDHMALLDKQHLIEEILGDADSSADAAWRLREALSHHRGLNVIVREPGAETIFSSDGFSYPRLFLPAEKLDDHGLLLHWKDKGQEFHGQRVEVSPGYAPSSRLDVLVAVDTGVHEQFMAELRRKFVLYAVLAVIISGVLGWLAAYKGMAPLRAMKAKATTVSGQKLDERMPIEAVPVEMADLARELNRMLERLQEDFQQLSAFSSDLAHELRTPISNLLTQTQVALAARRDADTYRDILASNAEEFQRLARMVSDMLFLAKTEHGVDLPNRECFSATDEVRALLEFYEGVADERHIGLGLEGGADIVGDRLMFRRAVSNLLSNALRHTHEHGEVIVRIAGAPDATSLTVANSGDDIDPAILPRLFDRFFRADPARPYAQADGAGLGLSITRAIVEAHGGRVTARSAKGRTEFELIFPR